jgi:hypothetical protein
MSQQLQRQQLHTVLHVACTEEEAAIDYGSSCCMQRGTVARAQQQQQSCSSNQ